MKRWNKYVKAFSMGIQDAMEYRLNFLLGIANFIFPLTIQYYMWTSIFRSSSGEQVYGYTYGQMIAYSVFAVLVSRVISGGVEWVVLEDIKNGTLSKYLVKPINYFNYRISFFMGQKIVNSSITCLVILFFVLLFGWLIGFSVGIYQVIFFIISLLNAIILTFIMYYILACISFWIEESWGFFVVFGVVVNVVSGGIFPLDIFGEKVIHLFELFPFYYTIYFSVNILTGRYDLAYSLKGIVIQIVWVLLLYGISQIVWNRGLKKFIAVGG